MHSSDGPAKQLATNGGCSIDAYHAGSKGLQMGLQGSKALLRRALLVALSVLQRDQLLAQLLCQRLSLHPGLNLILQRLLCPACNEDLDGQLLECAGEKPLLGPHKIPVVEMKTSGPL